MATKSILIPVLILSLTSSISSQERGVRISLQQCYNTSAIHGITAAYNRPPTSLNVFLEVIRRLEDANPTMSTRELSATILQRYRQDGIMRTTPHEDLSVSIPFNRLRLESYKGSLVLRRFLTNSSNTLYQGDLDNREICSFHYAISSTINNTIRGDESSTCTRSARYILRARRQVAAEPVTPQELPKDGSDVETVVEGIEGFGTRSVASGSSDQLSQCPVELGVVFTNFGTIKAGQVLAGIAAGLNQETVENSDNRYAVTIAGELAEAALAQAELNVQIGASGGWNSTINPQYYFLQKNIRLQITDAEIRGSLDGLYMALRGDQWRNKDLKISQMIDMYYSPVQRGILDSGFRACNRNILYSEMVTSEKLLTEVLNFIPPLDREATYSSTVPETSFERLAQSAVTNFNNYFPQMNTNDLSCVPQDAIERVATDLIIFIDSGWNYNTLSPVLSYILDNTDVNKFGSRYTIFGGSDGFNITSNNTRYLLDFYKQYNLTIHQNVRSGFDYTKVYEIMENIVKSKLDNRTYTGGESTVVLLIPRIIPNNDQKVFFEQKKNVIRNVLPDVSVLVLGTGSAADYSSITLTPNKDFVLLTDTTDENDIKRIGLSIVERIKNAPRAIVNPQCTSSFNGPSSSFNVIQYVEPRGVNYYRIAPNYFHSGGGGKTLKITENNYGTLQVCYSRDQNKPNNITSKCQTIRSTVMTVDINGYCSGPLADCAPIYLSVSGLNSDIKCTDQLCRFIDEVRYTVSMENVGCYSSSIRNVASTFLLITALFIFLKL